MFIFFCLQAFLIDVFARPKVGSFQRNYVNGGPPCDETHDEADDEGGYPTTYNDHDLRIFATQHMQKL